MKVNRETLDKIAHLARLELEEGSESGIQEGLSEILDWMDKLNELDTSKVNPLTNMSYEVNSFREDVAEKSLDRVKGLKNAPAKNQEFFIVPRVIN